MLDFPDRVKMIREFVATIDSASSGRFASPDGRNGMPLEVGYFRTQYITAHTAEAGIQAVLSKDGRVGVMEKEDRLLVTDYADNLAMVEKVLERIDHPRPQVRITALIYDISLQDHRKDRHQLERQGGSSVDIDGDGTRTRNTALDIDSITQVPFQAGRRRQHAHVHESEPPLRHHGVVLALAASKRRPAAGRSQRRRARKRRGDFREASRKSRTSN